MGIVARIARTVLTPRSLDRNGTLLAAERLSAATHLIATLELLSRPRDREPGGPNDWQISRQNVEKRGPIARKFFDMTSKPQVTTGLHLGRAAAAVFLLAPTGKMPRARLAANAVIAGSSLGTFPGQIYGTDGSDQASFLVQVTAAVARASRQPRVVDAALWFLALQSTLNYTASGWVKMVSPTWRSGRALPGVMRTVTYGHRGAWQVAERFPRSARTLAHGVLAMECLFPAVLASRGRLAPAFVTSAAAFHAANAGLMGLGRFVGAFCAMHPAVLYVTDPRRRVPAGNGPRRSDALPAVAGALAATTLAAGLAVRHRRRRAVGLVRPEHRRLVTGSGNSLAFLVRGAGADGPVILFESTLAATDRHWEWLRHDLSDRFTTVVYQRAGYGASEYRGGAAYNLDEAVADLADLATYVAQGRPVVIVGHALGAYLALRAAEALGGTAAGVVLVDPTHPGELVRSPRQAAGAAMLDTSLPLMAPSMRLGLGTLLQTPRALDRLPDTARQAALDQYRDDRLWVAARREWRAVRAAFAAFDGRLPKPDAQLLVLSAGRTLEDDAVQAELHREIGGAGSGATFAVIDGADHDTVITDREFAARVAAHVRAFALGLGRSR